MRTTTALLSLLLLVPMTAPAASVTRPARRPNLARMATVPAGRYLPLYRPVAQATGDGRVRVAAFRIDREPVTRGDFLAFVRDTPTWRRSNMKRVFAERGYLAGWRGDLDAGDASDLRRPVTGVSWFAAKAYCAGQGKRLPTVDEWEYVAAASETARDASHDPQFMQRLLALYAHRARGDALPPVGRGTRNAFGVGDMHDLVWEWTHDFNGVLVSGDSREAGSAAAARDHRAFCASAAIGAADPTNYPAFLRYGFRAGLTGRVTLQNLGFRCASGGAGGVSA